MIIGHEIQGVRGTKWLEVVLPAGDDQKRNGLFVPILTHDGAHQIMIKCSGFNAGVMPTQGLNASQQGLGSSQAGGSSSSTSRPRRGPAASASSSDGEGEQSVTSAGGSTGPLGSKQKSKSFATGDGTKKFSA